MKQSNGKGVKEKKRHMRKRKQENRKAKREEAKNWRNAANYCEIMKLLVARSVLTNVIVRLKKFPQFKIQIVQTSGVEFLRILKIE